MYIRTYVHIVCTVRTVHGSIVFMFMHTYVHMLLIHECKLVHICAHTYLYSRDFHPFLRVCLLPVSTCMYILVHLRMYIHTYQGFIFI